MFGWASATVVLASSTKRLHELVVARQLVADLLHDELLLEAARPPQGGQHDARHPAARQLALEHVLAEDLGVHSP
jgi:hypothetical protein